jgi:hypothetical protein
MRVFLAGVTGVLGTRELQGPIVGGRNQLPASTRVWSTTVKASPRAVQAAGVHDTLAGLFGCHSGRLAVPAGLPAPPAPGSAFNRVPPRRFGAWNSRRPGRPCFSR